MGPDTPRGRDFDGLWRYPGFRHVFWLFTVVWGVAYLAEAAARISPPPAKEPEPDFTPAPPIQTPAVAHDKVVTTRA